MDWGEKFSTELDVESALLEQVLNLFKNLK
jgi:hypothetical protein